MQWFNAKHRKTGTDGRTVKFTKATERENIKSGEKHSTLFGKIARYFEDLKTVAFTGSYNDLSGKPSAFPPAGHKHKKADITDFPGTMPPSAHKHKKADITDFPSSMPASDVPSWAKASSKPSYSWGEITSKPSSFTPSSHSHDYLPLSGGTVTGLITAKNIKGTINDRLYVENGLEAGQMSFLPDPDDEFVTYIGVRIPIDENKRPAWTCLKFKQYSNAFLIFPAIAKTGCLGGSAADEQLNTVGAVNIYNSAGLITSSDRNKKKDFEEITLEFAREIIDGLIPVSFLYRDGDSGRRHYGMVAQDVEELINSLGIDSKNFAPLVKKYPDKTIRKKTVNEDGEEIEIEELVPDYDAEPAYYLRYEGFAGIIIRYIQGLEQKDRELEERIAALEKIINQGA